MMDLHMQTGPIHIGHALNKILKDTIVRYKSLQGFRSDFIQDLIHMDFQQK